MIRRRRRNSLTSYFPFVFIVALLAGASFYMWNSFYNPEGHGRGISIVQEGEIPMVRLADSTNFIENQKIDMLFKNEAIRSKEGSITLKFFDNSSVRLDSNTTVEILESREHSGDSSVDIHLSLIAGRIWIDASQNINPNSRIKIDTPHFLFSTKGGNFSVDESSVATASGSGLVIIGKIFSQNIEVGQQIIFTPDDIQKIHSGGSGPQKNGIASDIQNSEWFVKNTKTIPSLKERGELQEIVFSDDTEKEILTEEDSLSIYILSPGKNGDTVTLNNDNVPISGTVPQGTQKVIVNGFTLSQFTPGDETFKYSAALKWNTLKKGKNKYKIVATGESDERYEAEITIIYSEDSLEEISTEKDEDSVYKDIQKITEEDATSTESKNILKEKEFTISSVKNGDIITKDIILISGKAPQEAVKIKVNNYTLSLFVQGDDTWNYRMSDALGNRYTGERTIIVKALDKNNAILATRTVTITVKEGGKKGVNKKYIPDIRGNTLPPVQQDDFGDPTI